jgi:hypothetical protein
MWGSVVGAYFERKFYIILCRDRDVHIAQKS